jgi:two-component system, OmpR family, sensor kinase
MFTKSIRWRFLLWLGFLLVCMVGGFTLTAYQLHRTDQLVQIDDELERRLGAISAAVRMPPRPFGDRVGRPMVEDGFGPLRPGRGPGPGDPPADREGRERPDGFDGSGGPMGPPNGLPLRFRQGFRRGPEPVLREVRLPAQALSLFDESDTNGFYFAVWARGGTLVKAATNAPANLPVPIQERGDTRTHTRSRGAFRESFHFTEMGDCVLAGRNIAADFRQMHRFGGWLVLAGVGVVAFGLGGGWQLASRALRPVEDISATARRISAGNLAERISVTETDNELGHLARVLNSTFARLDAAFAQQKQFTADASHELRTPLAVLISEAQTALARERTAGEYRETVEACLETAQQMRRLTESLLDLARLDSSEEAVPHEPIDLTDIARRCADRLAPLAQQREITIVSDLQPAEPWGDPDRLAQVITNLLTNAIHYNNPKGEVRVSTRTEHGFAVLQVSDTGIGISAEDLPHVFERFYRADKSRSRAEGRSGLGLAICHAIVDAHGGVIQVNSELHVGTTFIVQLPITRGVMPALS